MGIAEKNREHEPKIPRIRQPSCECADEEQEEDLNGTNPGYVAGRTVERRYVVGLEDAEGVDKAPCVHYYEMAQRNYLQSACKSHLVPSPPEQVIFLSKHHCPGLHLKFSRIPD